jgi:hypothetical protein
MCGTTSGVMMMYTFLDNGQRTLGLLKNAALWYVCTKDLNNFEQKEV